MDNSKTNIKPEFSAQEQKGCMLLAPTAERIVAAMSVLGWLVFLVKFAMI